jgi:hypothetical protein
MNDLGGFGQVVLENMRTFAAEVILDCRLVHGTEPQPDTAANIAVRCSAETGAVAVATTVRHRENTMAQHVILEAKNS